MSNGSGIPFNSAVTQASGMVSVQAGCSFGDAIVLMQARALRDDLTLDQIADGVLDRSIRFGE